jgi:hypothetical protein
LLDYAQLKADKFRQNVSKLNILETVEKVISIQRKQADDKGVRLHAEFEKFENTLRE